MSEYCSNCAGVAERYEDQVDRLGKKIVQLTQDLNAERESHAQLQVRCFDYGGTFQNVFDDLKETKALWHERSTTVRLHEIRICALERAMRKCIDDCADMSGALPIQTHALRWMTWLENALKATEAETTGDAK